MKNQPLVSINIRTFNSAKTLEETLQSIKNQTYKNTEIVISDGHSTDRTVEIAKTFGVRVHYADKIGDAKYQDYKMSRGDYIFGIDSDQIADRKVIEESLALCDKKGIDAVIVSERSVITKGTLIEKLLAYDKWIIDQSKDADRFFGSSFPRFFRKKLLDNLEWPKGLRVLDDMIIYSKLIAQGAKIGYVRNQYIRHQEITSWRVYVKKWFRYGKGYIGALREQPSTTITHSLPRRVYFSKIAFSKPHYLAGLIFLYFVKGTAAACGAISYFIGNMSIR